jgi:hypothetical protein
MSCSDVAAAAASWRCCCLPPSEILAATGLDYTFSGDYDYSIFKALREDATGIATPATYDYDYGQIQAIPQSAVATGRTSTELDNDVGRCANDDVDCVR